MCYLYSSAGFASGGAFKTEDSLVTMQLCTLWVWLSPAPVTLKSLYHAACKWFQGNWLFCADGVLCTLACGSLSFWALWVYAMWAHMYTHAVEY